MQGASKPGQATCRRARMTSLQRIGRVLEPLAAAPILPRLGADVGLEGAERSEAAPLLMTTLTAPRCRRSRPCQSGRAATIRRRPRRRSSGSLQTIHRLAVRWPRAGRRSAGGCRPPPRRGARRNDPAPPREDQRRAIAPRLRRPPRSSVTSSNSVSQRFSCDVLVQVDLRRPAPRSSSALVAPSSTAWAMSLDIDVVPENRASGFARRGSTGVAGGRRRRRRSGSAPPKLPRRGRASVARVSGRA